MTRLCDNYYPLGEKAKEKRTQNTHTTDIQSNREK